MSLLAGLLTSLSPCSLTSIPLIINYIKTPSKADSALKLSLIFSLGAAVSYITLGVIASLIGSLLDVPHKYWHIFLGILTLIMALQIVEIFNIIPPLNLNVRVMRKGGFAFLIGIFGGFLSSHCAAPILVILLGLIAQYANIFLSVIILVFFSIGHSIIIIISAVSIGFVTNLTQNSKYMQIAGFIKYILGALFIILSFYMFYLAAVE